MYYNPVDVEYVTELRRYSPVSDIIKAFAASDDKAIEIDWEDMEYASILSAISSFRIAIKATGNYGKMRPVRRQNKVFIVKEDA